VPAHEHERDKRDDDGEFDEGGQRDCVTVTVAFMNG
jgi:hypothetical protein